MWAFWMLRAQHWTPPWMCVSRPRPCPTCSSPRRPIRSCGSTLTRDNCFDRWQSEFIHLSRIAKMCLLFCTILKDILEVRLVCTTTLQAQTLHRFCINHKIFYRCLRCTSISVFLWLSVKTDGICSRPGRTPWRCGTTTCTWIRIHRYVCFDIGCIKIVIYSVDEVKHDPDSFLGVYWSFWNDQAGEVHTWSEGRGHCGWRPLLLGLPGTTTGGWTDSLSYP